MATLEQWRNGTPLSFLDGFSTTQQISSAKACGHIHFQGTHCTSVPAASTPVKAGMPTTAASLQGFTMPVDNRLTNSSGSTVTVRALGICMVDEDGSGSGVMSVYLARNGVLIPESYADIRLRGTPDRRAGVCQAIVVLEPGDFVEIWFANEANAQDICSTQMSLLLCE